MRANFLLRRLVTSFVVVAGVITITFFVARVLPSDPARTYAGIRARPEQVAALRTRFGLDRPLPEQYVRYLGDLVRGEFGTSFATKHSVREDLGIFLPATLELVLFGFALALLVGIPAGVIAGAREEGAFDRVTGIGAVLGATAPVLALALLAQQVFFNQLHWLPLNGRLDAGVSIAHPVTPMTGFLTIAGLTFAYAITGTVFVEVLFRWPGVGKYVVDAIVGKDFPPILAVTLVRTLIFVGVTFCTDLLRVALDPRVRR